MAYVSIFLIKFWAIVEKCVDTFPFVCKFSKTWMVNKNWAELPRIHYSNYFSLLVFSSNPTVAYHFIVSAVSIQTCKWISQKRHDILSGKPHQGLYMSRDRECTVIKFGKHSRKEAMWIGNGSNSLVQEWYQWIVVLLWTILIVWHWKISMSLHTDVKKLG